MFVVSFVSVHLSLLSVSGVDTDELQKSIFAKEGESVTLKTGFTEINHHIIWKFEKTIIAHIYSSINANSNYVNSKIFKNRLRVNFKTGSLTIKNIRTTDSGLYYLNNIIPHIQAKVRLTSFNVTVYG